MIKFSCVACENASDEPSGQSLVSALDHLSSPSTQPRPLPRDSKLRRPPLTWSLSTTSLYLVVISYTPSHVASTHAPPITSTVSPRLHATHTLAPTHRAVSLQALQNSTAFPGLFTASARCAYSRHAHYHQCYQSND